MPAPDPTRTTDYVPPTEPAALPVPPGPLDATTTAGDAPAHSPPADGGGTRLSAGLPSVPSGAVAAVTGSDRPTGGGPDGLPAPPPGFSIEHELGRGGMGVVYLARQTGLNRPAALKMLLGPVDARTTIRFLAESEAVASVRHPNVVEVYQFGDHLGRPFLALEFCPGGSLDAHLRTTRYPPAEAVEVLAAVAEGVAAAHAQGIVHRDLKPGNVLLDAAGRPKVTDFGLAKRGTGAELTRTNAVMGTPAYMPPEQAQGATKFVGPAADVWALGVMLYELLTGIRPFDGTDTWQTLAAVMRGDVRPPRAVAPAVPRDLERVCLKCLEKAPADRYPTAAELAADLRRWAAGEPVSVRPAGRAERLARWARRNPTRAAAYALVFVSVGLLSGGAGAVWLWREAESARGEAVAARDRLADEKQQTQTALLGETVAKSEAEVARDRLNRLDALRSVDLAYQQFRAGAVFEADRLRNRCPESVRSWEWWFVDRLLATGNNSELDLPGPGTACSAVAVSPDGRHLAYGFTNGSFGVYDWAAGQQVFAVNPKTPAVLPILAVGFGPDGRTVWANRVGEWVEADFVARTIGRRVTPGYILGGGFYSAGGQRQVRQTARENAFPLHVWDTSGPTPVRGPELVGHTGFVTGYGAFTADGRRVVTPGVDRTARVWEAATGKLLHTLAGHDGVVHAAAFSPDGSRVATASLDGTARIWDAASGRAVVTLRGHSAGVVRVAFSPDGRRVLTGSQDRSARVWDAATGREVLVLHNHGIQVDGVAFFPDGGWVLTGSWDRVKVWRVGANPDRTPLEVEADDRPEVSVQRLQSTLVAPTVFTPDGRLAVGGWYEEKARVWDATTGESVRAWAPFTSRTTAAGVSADGRLLLTGSQKGTIRAWPAAGGDVAVTFRGHTEAVRAVLGLPDGRVVSAADDTTVRVWDGGRGDERLKLTGYKKDRAALAATPDGRLLAAGVEGGVRVWDAGTGGEVRFLPTRREWGAISLAFSPDGRLLACGDQGELVVWETATGAERVRTGDLWSNVQGLAFTPDGARVATGTFDGVIKLWDVATGYEALTLRPDCGQVVSLDHVG